MTCKGYKRTAHETTHLHAHKLCDGCYMARYRDEHLVELQAYQKEYRSDAGYRQAAREYMRQYRKEHNL